MKKKQGYGLLTYQNFGRDKAILVVGDHECVCMYTQLLLPTKPIIEKLQTVEDSYQMGLLLENYCEDFAIEERPLSIISANLPTIFIKVEGVTNKEPQPKEQIFVMGYADVECTILLKEWDRLRFHSFESFMGFKRLSSRANNLMVIGFDLPEVKA